MTLGEKIKERRTAHGLTQEILAQEMGVSRQAVAKWELGESTPDLLRCDALAALYDVSLDDLLRFDQRPGRLPLPPRGKHIFGVVQMGERGQIVIPKRARELFSLGKGEELVVLGDTNPGTAGIALVPAQFFTGLLELANQVQQDADRQEEES